MTDRRLLPTGATEPLEMHASTLGVGQVYEVFAFGADRRLTIASGARRLTIEPLTGFPLAQVRTAASEQHVMVEALTTTHDALTRDLFPVATPGRPYRATLRLSIDEISFDRPQLTAFPRPDLHRPADRDGRRSASAVCVTRLFGAQAGVRPERSSAGC